MPCGRFWSGLGYERTLRQPSRRLGVQHHLGDLNTRKAPTLNPKDFVDETFEYYSIPDFQRDQCPSFINGGAIESSKLLLKPKTVLFGETESKSGKGLACRRITRIQADRLNRVDHHLAE